MKHLMRSAFAASVLLASAMPAFADARTEAYVQKNAGEVLKSLNNPDLSAAQRTAAFSGYMDKFTNLDAVSNFVIGKYSRRFTRRNSPGTARRSALMRWPSMNTSWMPTAAKRWW